MIDWSDDVDARLRKLESAVRELNPGLDLPSPMPKISRHRLQDRPAMIHIGPAHDPTAIITDKITHVEPVTERESGQYGFVIGLVSRETLTCLCDDEAEAVTMRARLLQVLAP